MKKLFFIIQLFTVLCMWTSSTVAQELQSSHRDWLAYTQNTNGKLVCYLVSYPISSNGNYSFRSSPYLMVTHINEDTDEVNVTGGYKYKEGTQPRINIDGTKYRMGLVKDETAWMRTRKYDDILIKKMKEGHRMKVTGTSTKGTYSIDTYSLSGFTNAYKKMKKLCQHSNFTLAE